MRIQRLAAWTLLGACLAAQGGPGGGPQPLKGLRIHEWGVFLIGKDGCKTAGGGEAPDFIQRVPGNLSPLAPDPGGLDRAREPILHVYAPEDLRCLHVEVGFPGGRPTLAWPKAQASLKDLWPGDGCIRTKLPAVPCLTWDLQVSGKDEAQPPEVPEAHWINAVRKVGSNLLRSGKDAERFLFYEGELKSERTFSVVFAKDDPDVFVLTGFGTAEAWVVRGGGKDPCGKHLSRLEVTQLKAHEAEPVPGLIKPLPAQDLQADLHKALTAAGLSEAEATALLTIWIPELTKPGTRLVYVLPRSEYDRLLPIRFSPQPEELVRVGLVVQEISP